MISNMKKKYILIILLIILSILFILFACVIKNNKEDNFDDYKNKANDTIVFDGEYVDKSFIDIKNDLLNSEHCENNICVSITKISCNDNLGSIYYKVSNKGNFNVNGFFVINLDSNKFYLKYNNLEIGQSNESYHNYKKIDLTKAKDFKLSLLSDEEGSKHFK